MGFYANVRRYMGVHTPAAAGYKRAARAPTAADTKFDFGTIWIDTATNDVYCLTSTTAGSANWELLGNSSGSPMGVASGGTGRATLTANATLVGNTTTAVKMVGPGTNGQAYLGATGAAPAWATLTSSDGSVTWTTGANALGAAITSATTAQKGGTTLATGAEAIGGAEATKIVTADTLRQKLGAQTNHGLLVGAGSAAAVTALAVGANGTIPIGSTGGDPAMGLITGLTGLTMTVGANSLALEVAENYLRHDTITVSSAELKALRAAPKTLVAAPAAGKMLRFQSIVIEYIYNTTAYTITAGGDDFAVKYTDGAGKQVSQTIDSAGVIDQVASTITNGEPAIDWKVANTASVAQPLVLHNVGANEWTLGDGTLKVFITYRIVTV